MFVRNDPQISKQEYYQDSLLKRPTASMSALENLSAGFITPLALAQDVSNMFSQKPEGNPLRDAVEGVDIMNQMPGASWGQGAANWLSNMVGYGLNPINWGFGRLGGMATEAAIGGAAKIAPDAVNVFMRTPIQDMVGENVGKFIPKVGAGKDIPLSLAIAGEKSAQAFGTFAGAGVPAAVFENYNADTRHINWGGVAKDMGYMGAFGLAIDSVPFAWGVLKSRVNRSLGKDVSDIVTPQDYQKAFEDGTISKDEYEWITDYHNNPLDTENLKQRATQILADDGHPVNVADHNVPFEILNSGDIDNLRSATNDQALSDSPEQYKTALSDFVVHNGLDAIRENPKLLDGVRGYVDFINQKLKDKSSKLADADKILDDHLLTSVKDFMPFSQKEMFKSMKKMGFESSHVRNIPLTVPENMVEHLKINEKINYLEGKLKDAKKKAGEGYQPNKQTLRRIEELTARLPKILTPKEELVQLRESLLSGKELPKNWERSKDYHRLVDLSHVWHNAKTLLDRVHLEAQYERQEAYKNLASHALQLSDSDVGRFGNRSDVMNYMKARIEGKIFDREPIAGAEVKAAEQNQIPADSETVMKEQETQVQQSKAEKLSDEFMQSSEKYKEFNSSQNVFKNLIQCVLGSMNG